MASNSEKYQAIADQILAQLGDDPGQWQAQWHKLGNAKNLENRSYSGINAFTLAFAPYSSRHWGTYKALTAKGLQVQKGEKGTAVIYFAMIQKDDDTKFPLMKSYKVFNIDQCEGDKSQFVTELPKASDSRIPALDEFINSHGVPIHHGGDRAYYSPSTHEIQLPEFEQFHSATAYYATAFHELVHSTKKELGREQSQQFGDPIYAFEELIAESGSAILCSEFELTPEIRPDHAQYIKSWIKGLKDDPTTFAKAFAQASKAVTILTKNKKDQKELQVA